MSQPPKSAEPETPGPAERESASSATRSTMNRRDALRMAFIGSAALSVEGLERGSRERVEETAILIDDVERTVDCDGEANLIIVENVCRERAHRAALPSGSFGCV